MKCLQANLHHAKAASAEISRRFAGGIINIGLIQEPWISRGHIRGLNTKNTQVNYDTGAAKPRAALIINTNINYLPLTEFMDGDTAVVLVEADLNGSRLEVVIASAYFPGDADEAPPPNIKGLVEHCKRHRKTLIIGCDANAHNTVWGSTDTNTRGESLLEFLISSNMGIVNRGNNPTFSNAIREEVLDLTLITNKSLDMIGDWRVSEEDSMSDHKHIIFEIRGLVKSQTLYRNPRATDWTNYSECLQSRITGSTFPTTSTEDLDVSAAELTDIVISSFQENCPLKMKSSTKRVPWWNRNLEKLRKTARLEFNKAKRSGNWDRYREALTIYNRELRKSKRKSWRLLCEELRDIPATARLHKALSKGAINPVGTLREPEGTYTSTFNSTLELLLRTHFPDCRFHASGADERRVPTYIHHGTMNQAIRKIVTFEKVEWAVNSFRPYKSPGPDGIFPALLSKGNASLFRAMVNIFRSSLTLGYVPEIWRGVKVIFIPKGGNKPPESPKSYRPISLSSFMLKTLEKILDQYLRAEVLTMSPLHGLQFAYQKGKSTVTALHKLVLDIEKALDSKEIALCAFMDIEGAFDNANFLAMETALSRRGADPAVVKWISNMLKQRLIRASLGSTDLSVTAVKGCPQGGVLSPLLWSVLVDDLIRILNRKGYKTIGYADDISVIIRGNHPGTVGELMQDALYTTWEWCRMEGLSINPTKTTIVPFTKKRVIEIPILKINGIEVVPKEEVKYLGIVLDRKLTWEPHLESVLKKAIKHLWTAKQLLGRSWGLSPKMTYWIYTQLVKPKILYGSLVWWGKTKQKTAIRRLCRVQRLACLCVTGAMRSTPTAGMEALLNLTPLNVAVQEEATFQAISIHRREKFKAGNLIGHLTILKGIGDIIYMSTASDTIDPVQCFVRKYRVYFPTREEWCANPRWLRDGSQKWYTDGSKTLQGVGAGIVGPRAHRAITLSKDTTIFQAELYAILETVGILSERGYMGVSIKILSDSQAVLKALNSCTFTSSVVLECHNRLNDLATQNQITLIWVPGHEGHRGNEMADIYAKKGAEGTFIGPSPSFGFNRGLLKEEIRKWTKSIVEKHWNDINGLEHSKKFLNFDARRADLALKMDRKGLRLLAGALTGHHTCNKHLYRIGLSTTYTCRFCGEEEESMEHLITNCAALGHRRHRILHAYTLGEQDLLTLPLKELVLFLDVLNP